MGVSACVLWGAGRVSARAAFLSENVGQPPLPKKQRARAFAFFRGEKAAGGARTRTSLSSCFSRRARLPISPQHEEAKARGGYNPTLVIVALPQH